MPTLISAIETLARQRLVEPKPKFWASQELVDIIVAGIRDLWRDTVDLKQEHYLKVNNTDVSLVQNTNTLTGVPSDVHKIYMIEGLDLSENSPFVGLVFTPLDYNHIYFQAARARGTVDPASTTVYYSIMGEGAPVNAPTIRVAPMVSSTVPLSFCYVPTLGPLTKDDAVPIPGECDNALIAWTVAFARAKESEDRAPDANWLSIYATEKQHLLQSLGLRQYQEPSYADAMWQEYW